MRIGSARDESMQIDVGAADILNDVRERGNRGQDLRAIGLGSGAVAPIISTVSPASTLTSTIQSRLSMPCGISPLRRAIKTLLSASIVTKHHHHSQPVRSNVSIIADRTPRHIANGLLDG